MAVFPLLKGARRSKIAVALVLTVLAFAYVTFVAFPAHHHGHSHPLPPKLIPHPPRPGGPPKAASPAGRPLRRVKDAASLLIEPAPDFPPADSLRHPSSFTQFARPPASAPPVVEAFPDALLAQIRPAAWEGTAAPAAGTWDPPHGSFARAWKAPEWLDLGARSQQPSIPNIQFDFPPAGERNAARRKLTAERQQVVRNAFLHAWEGYKKKAWGSDEVRPVTGLRSDPFMGYGASIIDTLNTLLLMRLPEEYMHAREHVRNVDFGIISGIDWGRGPAQLGRNVATIHAFEVTIRYLGGLLGAYDLGGDPLMLKRAEELGKIILPIFDTSSGVPMSRINPKNPVHSYGGHTIQLAEAGTLALEYTRLSQLTGNRTYFDLAQRGMDYLDQVLAPKSAFAPLLPTQFGTEGWRGGMAGTFSFGGMADSYYEYLIKQHILLRGAVPRYAQIYSQTIDRAAEVLFKSPIVPGKNLLTVGELKSGRYQHAMEHLSCFTGAMMALGSKALTYRKKDMYQAKLISQTCYYIGSNTESGMQPERADFYDPDAPQRVEKVMDDDSEEVFEIPRGKPQGVKSMHKHYLSRPESLESVFYMYRTTGDERYQDQGWRMFVDWIDKTETEWGFASVEDVNRSPPRLKDSMESFVFAETFKYYYLLFAADESSPASLSLDTFVVNTECHPFIHADGHAPGDSGLLDRALIPKDDDERPVGGGTDAQKWAVWNNMQALGMLENTAKGEGKQ